MASGSQSVVPIGDPYLGPQPFQRADRELFFGRSKETRDLLSLVTAHGEVLLYAQSGSGKTSLLNAGLIPLLESKGFEVLEPARVCGPLPPEIPPEEIKNPYILNLLATWVGPHADPTQLAKLSLRYFLENRAGASGPGGRPRPCVLILDQLEEIFQTGPEHRQHRKNFFDQVGDALEQDRRLRVVFTMREDYIAHLAPYFQCLPEQMKIRYRLEPLRQDGALQAVTGPLPKIQGCRRSFAAGVADKLVQDLLKIRVAGGEKTGENLGEFVEPVQLQVVCDSLWRELPPEVDLITEDHLRDFGDVNRALSRFYETCLEKVMRETGVTEGVLRRWFGQSLITPAETRGMVFRDQEQTGGIPNAAADLLVRLHLIRQEQRSGSGWYELNHDRFIEPILRSNREWLLKRGPALEVLRRLEEKAAAWTAAGRQGVPLDEAELNEAEHWLKSREAADIGCSPTLLELVRVSRFHLEARVREEQRKLEAERVRAAEAHSRELAAAAINNTVLDPDLSVLLALEAEACKPTLEAVEALHQVVLCCRTRLVFSGHRGPVFGVAFSPDATCVGTAGADRTARLWDLRSAREPRILRGHTDQVYSLAFSPDSRSIATASFDHSVRIWDTASGQERMALCGHQGPIIAVAFSPDGRQLATASFDQTARLWDAASGRELLSLTGHQGPVIGVSFSPRQAVLATGSLDRTARTWDLASSRELHRFNWHKGAVYGVAFSPDGEHVASSSLDQTARVWEAATGRQVLVLKGHTAMLGMVAFSADGSRLATASADGTARVWDACTGRELACLLGHHGLVFGVAFGPECLLATASWDGTARIWGVSTDMRLVGHTDEIKHVAFSADGRRLATSSADGSARIWDAASGKELCTLSGHRSLVYDVVFDPGGQRVATAALDNTARIWEVASGREILTLSGHPAPVFGVAFSLDGRRLATASCDATAKVWDSSSGRELVTLRGHRDLVYEAIFSPDGSRLATASADRTARIWDAGTGLELLRLNGHQGLVYDLSWSPDGTRLATASSDGTARVWDTGTGAQILLLNDHISSVNAVTFSQDGRRIATGSSDRTAMVWDAQTGEHLATLPGHTGVVNGVAFSPDGKRLATAGADHFVNLHVLDVGELREMARQRAIRQFTPEERRKYLHLEG